MALCRITKASGDPCKGTAISAEGYCGAHDPKHAEHRRRGAVKGGKGKPGTEIRDLKKQLTDLTADVLEGKVETGRAAVVNQIHNTRARLIELERKIREQDDLEERLEALERKTTGSLEKGRPWAT